MEWMMETLVMMAIVENLMALLYITTKGDGIIYEKLMKNYFKVLGVSFEDM